MKHTVPIKANIHNRFDIEVVRDGKTVQKAYAENIILNALWTRMLTPSTWNSYIFFGTGTGILSAARTSLFTHLGNKAVTGQAVEVNSADGYISHRYMISLDPEEYVGQELSEVGIGYGTTSTNLVTHATLKDMNGNPTTIEKKAVDVINIYSTVYLQLPIGMTWDSGAVAFPQNVSPNKNMATDSFTAWIFGRRNVTYLLHALNLKRAFNRARSANSTADGCVTKIPTQSYSVANKKVTFSARFAVGEANFPEGIGCVELYLYNDTGDFSPTIVLSADLTQPAIYTGSSIEGESIGEGNGTTQDFATNYQIKPGSTPTVKVDGTPVSSGITVDVGKPIRDDIRAYMRTIGNDYTTSGSSARDSVTWSLTENTVYGIGGPLIFENTLWETYGIWEFVAPYRYLALYASTDMSTWETIGTADSNGATISVPEAYRNYRYWKVAQTYGDVTAYKHLNTAQFISGDLTSDTDNIHFDTPPDVGAVITVDYVTPWVAKDTNHVFDFTLELQFGEYTP